MATLINITDPFLVLQKGQADGVASLDPSSKLPLAQLPSLTTSLVSEGSNLYYTDTRVQTFSDNRYAFRATTILPSGSGLLGGGDLSTSRVFSLDFSYLDDRYLSGYKQKAPVRVATTANITLSGTQTIDGVSLVVGDRVLVKNQTLGQDNGIYIVSAGAWTRSTDFDTASPDEVSQGAAIFAQEGTSLGKTGWSLSTPDPITLGTTPLTFIQYSGANAYSAGTGLQLIGNQFSALNATALWNANQFQGVPVSNTTPTSGQLYQYNGTSWVPFTPSYLTGNQTITLSGDVTGSGSTSIATTVSATAVRNKLSAGVGISYNSTTGVITNSAPDQTVTLTQGSGVTITGSYPGFTISATGSGGTVTSVGFTSTDLTVSGSPISSNGTITANITNNAVTFAKIQDITAARLLGRYSTTLGDPQEIQIGTGLTLNSTTGVLSGNTGTVTSVGMTVPSIFSIGGSPITSSGVLSLSLTGQVANTVFSGPTTGANAVPTFRALVVNDIPALTSTKISNFVSSARSSISAGTGITYNSTTGVITNSSPAQTVTLTAGTGISIGGSYPAFTITNTAPNVTPNLSQVLAAGNTANNNVVLGTVGDTNQRSYQSIRNVSGTNYTAGFAVYGTAAQAGSVITTQDGSGTNTKVLVLPYSNTTALYSPDGGGNFYSLWHSNNHPAGNSLAPSLSGANVLASLTTNAAGHVTAATTRVLTIGDIGAAPSSGSGNYIQNQNAVIQTASAAISGGIRADGKSLFASTTGIRGTSTGMANTAYFSFYETGGTTRQAFIGKGSSGNNNLYVLSDIGAVHVAAGTVFNSTISDGYALQIIQNAATGTTIGNDGTYSYIQSWSRPLKINNQGNNTLINTNTGNVGVGVSTPSFKVHVNSGTTSTGVMAQSSTSLGATSGAFLSGFATGIPTAANQRLGGLAIGSNTTGVNYRTGARVTALSEGAWTDSVSHPTYLAFYTTGSGESSDNERMRITGDGRVGINTSSPSVDSMLTVDGLITANGVKSLSTLDLTASTDIYFNTGGSTRAYVTNQGLGVSTVPSPARGSVLQVQGNVWSTDAYILGITNSPIAEFFISGSDSVGIRTMMSTGTMQFSVGTDGATSAITIPPTGNTVIEKQIQIKGGTPGAGKVLTSDGTGLATWQTPAVGSTPTLTQVLTAGNTAQNEITLGTAGNAGFTGYRNIRNVSSLDYNTSLGISTLAEYTLLIGNGTAAQNKIILLPFSGTTLQYSPNNGTNKYDVWHSNNHQAGSAFTPTLTGANVLSTMTVNSAGHISALTTRALTPTDIGAAPANGSSNYIHNQSAITQNGSFRISGEGRTDGYFRVQKDGSNGLSNYYTLINAAGTRGAVMQLNADANPGLATYIHNGTAWTKRLEILSSGATTVNGTFTANDTLVNGDLTVTGTPGVGSGRAIISSTTGGGRIAGYGHNGTTWVSGGLNFDGTNHNFEGGDVFIQQDLEVSGTVTATGGGFNSARSLKEDIREFTNSALEIISKIPIKQFKYKNGNNNTIGFIADEVPKEVLVDGKEAMDVYSTIGVLIKSVQELNERLNGLGNINK